MPGACQKSGASGNDQRAREAVSGHDGALARLGSRHSRSHTSLDARHSPFEKIMRQAGNRKQVSIDRTRNLRGGEKVVRLLWHVVRHSDRDQLRGEQLSDRKIIIYRHHELKLCFFSPFYSSRLPLRSRLNLQSKLFLYKSGFVRQINIVRVKMSE